MSAEADPFQHPPQHFLVTNTSPGWNTSLRTWCTNRPPVLLAWARRGYADTLLQRENPEDHEQATALLDESLTISSELGMGTMMERMLSRRDIMKA